MAGTTRRGSEVRFLDRMRRAAFIPQGRNLAPGFRCTLNPGYSYSAFRLRASLIARQICSGVAGSGRSVIPHGESASMMA